MSASRAIFLDRDGVINEMVPSPEGPDSPRSPDEFKLIAGAAAAVRRLKQLGLPVVVVSNQPGVAKGKFPEATHLAIIESMNSGLGEEMAVPDAVYYCMHHPQAVVERYRETCECRKPKPGLLIRAATDMNLDLAGSYMVGDHPRDMVAGKAVGCTTIFVDSASLGDTPGQADHVCEDLSSAARLIFQLENAGVATH